MIKMTKAQAATLQHIFDKKAQRAFLFDEKFFSAKDVTTQLPTLEALCKMGYLVEVDFDNKSIQFSPRTARHFSVTEKAEEWNFKRRK